MVSDDNVYIKLCKQQIEEMLGYSGNVIWKQRDYLNLIELIETKTGITLSLSTIKRIWKPDFEGIPHPSTLDAFALFLGYNSWLNFKKENQQIILKQNSYSKKLNQAGFIKKRPVVIFLIIIFISGIAYYFFNTNRNNIKLEKVLFNTESVAFSFKNSKSFGVPNTVIFRYDVSKVIADSFFIQQSWNKFRRDKIQKNDKNLTSLYYYPGYHRAKLIANDSIIKDTLVKIFTENWLSLARFDYRDESPIYIKDKSVVSNGLLHVSREQLEQNNVEINEKTMVSYFLVNDFNNISSSNFSFETKVKCDSLINTNCPHISICVYGEEDMMFISLMAKGCEEIAVIKVGKVMKRGKNNDLSAFGVDLYSWQKFELRVENNQLYIYINDTPCFELPINRSIGDIVGFNLNFSGTGSIDYVTLRDQAEKTVYKNDFDAL